MVWRDPPDVEHNGVSFLRAFFFAMFPSPHFFRHWMQAHTWTAVCACTALALWCAPIQAQDGTAVRHLRIVGGLGMSDWPEMLPATAPPMSMTSASTMAKTGRSMKKRAIAGV